MSIQSVAKTIAEHPIIKGITKLFKIAVGIPLATAATAVLGIGLVLAQTAKLTHAHFLKKFGMGKQLTFDIGLTEISDFFKKAIYKTWSEFALEPYAAAAKWAEDYSERRVQDKEQIHQTNDHFEGDGSYEGDGASHTGDSGLDHSAYQYHRLQELAKVREDDNVKREIQERAQHLEELEKEAKKQADEFKAGIAKAEAEKKAQAAQEKADSDQKAEEEIRIKIAENRRKIEEMARAQKRDKENADQALRDAHKARTDNTPRTNCRAENATPLSSAAIEKTPIAT